MRKLFILLAVFAMLAVTGAVAAATTTTVTITKAGYVPSTPKISQGDSVQFTNSDTAPPPDPLQVDRGHYVHAESARAAARPKRHVHLPERRLDDVLRSE
jgi:plastocyanin